MRPLVFLDTNSLFADKRLSGQVLGRLFALSRRQLIDVAIPRVVILEVARQWQNNELANSLTSLKGLSRKYETHLDVLGITEAPDLSGLRLPSAEEAMSRYRAGVAARLGDAHVEVLPLPTTSHEDILQRDLDGRAPFQSSGKGYRDTLSWEAIKVRIADAELGTDVYLVTDDNDFGKDGRLDEGLAREVAKLGHNVVRVNNVATLLEKEEFQLKTLEVERDLSFFESRDLASIVAAAVLREVEDLYGTDISRSEADEVGIPTGIEDIRLDVVSPSIGPEWEAYDELDGTTILGEARLWADVHFIGHVGPGDYSVLSYPGIEELVWEADGARILFSLPVRLLFAVRVEMGSESVDMIEYSGLEPG